MSRYAYDDERLSRSISNTNATPRKGRKNYDTSERVVIHRAESNQPDTPSRLEPQNRFNMYLNYSGTPNHANSAAPPAKQPLRQETVSPDDIELASADQAVFQAPYFPNAARQKTLPAIDRTSSKPYRPPSYYQSPSYDAQSKCPRKFVLGTHAILTLIAIILAFFSFWSVWSESIMVDQGSSGIVVWQEITSYDFYLTDFEHIETGTLQKYDNMPGDDYRADCGNSGQQSLALLGLSVVCMFIGLVLSVVHLLIENMDAWDKRTRCLFLSILILGFFTCFFITLGVGSWWFGCHADIISHAESIAWNSAVAEVYTTIELGVGFGVTFLNCGLVILSTSLFTAFYRRG